jgi:hypothetical protein
MFPPPGLEEQAGAQISQGLLQILIRPMENDPMPGNIATFFYRAAMFVTVKGMSEWKNIFPGGAPGWNIFFYQ